MVAARSEVDQIFEALSDPTRRHVVQLLGTRPRRAGELAGFAKMSPPAMSRHLRVLLEAGIVTDQRSPDDARLRIFHLRPESMVAIRAWLDQVQAQWNDQLRSFKRHVESRRPS